MSTRIIFNGKTYSDPSDMPAAVRQAYQRALGFLAGADRNGIPDLLEAAGLGNVISIQRSQIIVNGQTYSGPEEMPPAIRQLYDQALSQGGANRNDVPDLLRGSSSIQVRSGGFVGGPQLQVERGSSPSVGSGLSRLLLLVGGAVLGFILAALWLWLGR